MPRLSHTKITNKSIDEITMLELIVSKCVEYDYNSTLSEEEVNTIRGIINEVKDRQYIKGFDNIRDYYRTLNINRIMDD